MENKKCPKCEKLMLNKNTGTMLLFNPPLFPTVWKCGCGHQERGPTIRGEREEDTFLREWEDLNNIVKPTEGEG